MLSLPLPSYPSLPPLPPRKVLLIRFVALRTAASRDVYRLATAAAESGQPLAIAPAALAFVSTVREALRERGTLLESLEECPAQEGRVELDPPFLDQVWHVCVRACVRVCLFLLKSLEECPAQEGRVELDPPFLDQVWHVCVHACVRACVRVCVCAFVFLFFLSCFLCPYLLLFYFFNSVFLVRQ